MTRTLPMLTLLVALTQAQDKEAAVMLQDTGDVYTEYRQTITLTSAVDIEQPPKNVSLATMNRRVMVETVFLLRQRKTAGEELEGMVKMKSVRAEWGDVASLKSAGTDWKKDKEWETNFWVKPFGEVGKGDKEGLHKELIRKTSDKEFANVATAYFLANYHLWGFAAQKNPKPNRPWRIELKVPLTYVFGFEGTLARTIEMGLSPDDRWLLAGVDKDFTIASSAKLPTAKDPRYWITHVDKKLNTTVGSVHVGFDPKMGIVTSLESECALVYTDTGFKFNNQDVRVKASFKMDVKVQRLP